MNTCANCGSEDWLPVKQGRLILVRRCNVCGREQQMLVSPAGHPELPANLEPVFEVTARWASVPTSHEIDELRARFRLMPESADDLSRKAQQCEKFSLGRLNESEMRSHTPFLQRLGLELEQIPVTRK
jgi:hypothetical protein